MLEACAREGVAVVPFGGGTSVVGGVDPERGGFSRRRGPRPRATGRRRGRRRGLGPGAGRRGLRVAELERLLGARGLTAGHLPQSFEHVTVGGCAATRSAGQASTGYGRFDELVRGLRAAAPAGDLDVAPVPASAAGPSLRELLLGSEGTLGVLTR